MSITKSIIENIRTFSETYATPKEQLKTMNLFQSLHHKSRFVGVSRHKKSESIRALFPSLIKTVLICGTPPAVYDGSEALTRRRWACRHRIRLELVTTLQCSASWLPTQCRKHLLLSLLLTDILIFLT